MNRQRKVLVTVTYNELGVIVDTKTEELDSSAQPDVTDINVGDTISRKWLIECVEEGWIKFDTEKDKNKFIHLVRDTAPSAQPEQRWTPIKWHDSTAEESEKYGFGEEIVAVFDCDMPSDNQEILVTTSHGYVEKDVCYIDEGFSLDSGYDWIEDITAWMPLPEPWRGGQDE